MRTRMVRGFERWRGKKDFVNARFVGMLRVCLVFLLYEVIVFSAKLRKPYQNFN